MPVVRNIYFCNVWNSEGNLASNFPPYICIALVEREKWSPCRQGSWALFCCWPSPTTVWEDLKLRASQLKGNRQFLLWVKSFLLPPFPNIFWKTQFLQRTSLGITQYDLHLMEIWIGRGPTAKKKKKKAFFIWFVPAFTRFISLWTSVFMSIPVTSFTGELVYLKPTAEDIGVDKMPYFELTYLENGTFIVIPSFIFHGIKYLLFTRPWISFDLLLPPQPWWTLQSGKHWCKKNAVTTLQSPLTMWFVPEKERWELSSNSASHYGSALQEGCRGSPPHSPSGTLIWQCPEFPSLWKSFRLWIAKRRIFLSFQPSPSGAPAAG